MTSQQGSRSVLAGVVFFAALLGCGGGASVADSASALQSPATSAESRSSLGQRVRLFAEGVVDLRFVIPPGAPDPAPGFEYRGRFQFPAGGADVLDAIIFVAPAGSANGVEPIFVISHWLTKIDRFETSHTPENNLMLTGRVIATPVASPFGPLVGRIAAYTGGYTPGRNATFTLFGGSVSGNHTTLLPTATGSLILRGDDNNDD
jgi:hypothetical protein